ncbi:Sterol 3-beta-glucosyltransferase [Zea mays]|uniref:Sterol 3-beta-glucosyltransferase n=1 Tax=Zea mays TaxID=4577 RepID=A0A1D6N6C5_MAIZE|nr:Sterol 3-beta-glucosyltransferase [Zea mays]
MGSGPTVDTLEYIVFSVHVAAPEPVHVVGSGAVHHATRDSCVGTTSPCCSKGYPCFRVPTTGIEQLPPSIL